MTTAIPNRGEMGRGGKNREYYRMRFKAFEEETGWRLKGPLALSSFA